MKLKPPSFLSRGRGAFALVVVLIVISVLALVAVGFLSSMGQERATASAFANKTRAEQSAQSGVDTAMGILRDYFKAFPDSATVWDTTQSKNSGDTTTNEGTTLYFRAVSTAPDNAASDTPVINPGMTTDPTTYNNADYVSGNGPNNLDPTTGVDNRKIFVLPLVSGTVATRLENKANAVRASGDTATASALTTNGTTPNGVNLNARRFASDTTGWLGTPPGYTDPSGKNLPKPFTVPWVEIRQQDGVAVGSTGPVIGRYAFWVEDESFRANISYAGLGDVSGPNGIHQRRDNSLNHQLNPTDVDLLGVMTFFGLNNGTATQYAQNLFDLRSKYPGNTLPDSLAFTHAKDFDANTLNPLRYVTTVSSSGLNLTRHGTQRLNLNAVMSPSGVTPATTIEKTTPTETTKIQYQVDTLVQTMLFHAPNLGQRLFRLVPTNSSGGAINSAGTVRPAVGLGSVTDPKVLDQMAVSHNQASTVIAENYAKQYFYKIAANVRDYIDADAFPTRVLAGGQVPAPAVPTIPFGDSGDNPVWAIGKDSGPFISECATRPRGSISGRTFDMFIDYYIEVWNMSNRDIKGSDLGPHPFVKVGNPTRWKVGQFTWWNTSNAPTATADLISDDGGPSPSDTRPSSTARDFTIDLSKMMQGSAPVPTDNTVIFPAGKMTVITTDSTWSTIISPTTEAAKHIIVCPWLSGKSEYKGHFPDDYTLSPTPATGPVDLIYMVLETNTGAAASLDSETDITLGSDWGYVDCLQGALPLTGSPRIQIPTPTGSYGSANQNTPNANYPTLFGGVLRGNWFNTSGSPSNLQASTSGDPRSNNEQLSYNNNSQTASDWSRFLAYENNTGNNSTTPSPSYPAAGLTQTLGLPNYRSTRPNRPENPWPDYIPYYTAVSPMTIPSPTAQELILTAAKAPAFLADGALTSIGQLGDIYDPSRQIEGTTTSPAATSASYVYSRGGGRSLKIGQHDDRWDGDETSASRSWNAWRLADIFGTSDAIQQPGLININGILRDNGVALRAALTGLVFQQTPLGDAALNAANLNVDQLVTELKARLSQTPINPDSSVNTGGTITVGGTPYPLQTGAGPFWERGELSEVRAFGRTPDPVKSGSGSQLSTTTPTVSYTQPQPGASEPAVFKTGGTSGTNIDPSSQLYPRGRDELFRRLVEMTTTRGNVFTVYAVGQAISQANPMDTSTRRVTATQQLKVTFRLVPKNKAAAGASNATDFHPGQDYSTFNPNDTDDMHQRRFAKPDHYDIEVLSVSSSNS